MNTPETEDQLKADDAKKDHTDCWYYPPDVATVEMKRREARLAELERVENAAAKAAGQAPPVPRHKPVIAGLALSGGGIRSATFCLGVLQALARGRALREFDFLSTVSGGGYVGSFFGSWVNRHGILVAEKGLAGRDALDDFSRPVRYLRENGRYLTPNGATDAWLTASAQVRNQFTLLWLLLLPLSGVLVWAEMVKAFFGKLPANWTAVAAPAPSVFWPGVAAIMILTVLPFGSGYWFVGAGTTKWFPRATVAVCLFWLGVCVAAGWRLWYALASVSVERGLVGAMVLGLLMIFTTIAAAATPQAEVPKRRREYSDYLAWWLGLGVMLAVFATVDSLGQWVAREVPLAWNAAAGPVTIGTLVALAQRVGPWLADLGKGERLKLPTQVWAWLAALVVGLLAFVILSALIHHGAVGFAHHWHWSNARAAAILGGLGIFCWGAAWFFGQDFRFVNLSSLHRVYSARLARAYVGATNPSRTTGLAPNFDATEVLPDDDLSWKSYDPGAKGGPDHLINMTLNETVSGQSNVDKEDRHGLGLTLGPVALTVGPRASIPTPIERVNVLSLGDWVGVSGAAFSTGMGANTSIPVSFLLCIFNVRLGFWWSAGDAFKAPNEPPIYPGKLRERDSRVEGWRAHFPAQDALLDEMMAQFHGPARRHWYLSDGGHFENTAVYELVRRRVPLVACCDCGADDTYEFEDIANLVRKARIDFGAEIVFWDAAEIARNAAALPALAGVIGTLDDMRARALVVGGASLAQKHAALAWINHADGPPSLLLVIKPTLTADCPIDLLQYDSTARTFPQQSTLDQFFDEAQWESYRKLGLCIGEKLFRPAATTVVSSGWTELCALVRRVRPDAHLLKPW